MDTNILLQMLPDGFKAEALTPDQVHEIIVLLLNDFKSAEYGATSTVGYPNLESPQIIARFSESGKLTSVVSAMSTADTEALCFRVRTELTVVGEEIGREALFTRDPVNGAWRYRDHFQILPVPAHAPKPKFGLQPHPFLIEFWFPKAGDPFRNMARRSRRVQELHLLLNALLDTGIRRIEGYRPTWMALPDDDGAPTLSVGCLYHCYTYQGFQPKSDELTPLQGFPKMPIVSASDYYSRRSWSPLEPFDLPDNLEESLDFFFSLPSNRRCQVERASYWLAQVNEIISHSLAFICIIQAIDALVGEAKKGQRTKRFLEFVRRFASSPAVSDTDREELFKIRSELSHGFRDPLHSDRELYMHPETGQDRERMWFASKVARICILNWIRTSDIELLRDSCMGLGKNTDGGADGGTNAGPDCPPRRHFAFASGAGGAAAPSGDAPGASNSTNSR
jgi:hypothetical protein